MLEACDLVESQTGHRPREMSTPKRSRSQRPANPAGPRLSASVAIAKLESLKAEAVDARSLYRAGDGPQAAWKAKVQAVLDRALGADSDLADKMRTNRYGLIAYSSDTPESAWERAFVSGVETAVGYIHGAIFDLRLMENAERSRGQQSAAATKGDRVSADTSPPDQRAVFVIHGRNLAARDAMFDFLRSLGLVPIEWSQAVRATGRPSPYVGEV